MSALQQLTDQVHHLFKKFPSVRGAGEAADIFQREENEGGDIDNVADL